VDPITVMDGSAAEELSDYVRSQYPDGLPPMGTDSLRFTMLTGSSPGNDLNISVQRVEGNRNFTNKIWNATRFTIGKLTAVPDLDLPDSQIEWSLADRWIRSRLHHIVGEVTRLYEAFQYGEAGRQLYDFFWSEFADWYIEIAKAQIDQGGMAAYSAGKTLVHVLEQTLRMLHPFIPFVTEETWGHLKRAAGDGFAPVEGWADGLMIASWPEAGGKDDGAESEMNLIIDLIRGIRNVRSEYQVQPGRRIAALIAAGDQASLVDGQRDALVQMARLNGEELVIAREIDPPDQASTTIVGGVVCYLPLADLVDLAAESERLTKELAEVEAMIARSEGQLAGPFSQRAPAPVVQRERDKLDDLKVRREQLDERLKALS
jgi:valyl-tRNA synthetase